MMVGVDATANCPVGGKIDFWYDQNPTMSPCTHAREEVLCMGVDIDRSISSVHVAEKWRKWDDAA